MGEQYPQPAPAEAARPERACAAAEARVDDGRSSASLPGRLGTLIAAALLAASCGQAGSAEKAETAGVFAWSDPRKSHGGYSAIEMTAAGDAAWVLSDRGELVRIAITRAGDGAISHVETKSVLRLKPKSVDLWDIDAEGLAVIGDRLIMSAERPAAIYQMDTDTGTLEPLASDPTWAGLVRNRQLEGLAADAEGNLWTLPENPGSDGTFALRILRDGTWRDGPRVTASDGFQAVALDFGPDGALYLLERKLAPPLGFASRLRRLDPTGTQDPKMLLETEPGQYDNLEGLSVWRDRDGHLRASMISDDNFLFLQRTEIVEVVLTP